MKIAVSIPDDVFQRAENVARRMGTSRSRLYAQAIAEFVAQRSEDLTSQINAIVDEESADDVAYARQAARRVFEQVEWKD